MTNTIRSWGFKEETPKKIIDIIEGSKVAIELRLLAHLFPPKGRFRTKKAQWKPSIPECKNSIIIGTTLLADITKIQNDRRKEAGDRGTTLQPYIVVVGPSIDVVQNSFVVVDNTVYEIPSTIAAIDLCYKIFQVFDLKYPIESAHLWLLLQRVLYNYSSDADPAFPQISEAIADLKTLDSQS